MKTLLTPAVLAFSLLAAPMAHALDPQLRELFDLWDRNGDTVVEGDEYHLGGDAPRFYDLDKDGVLTLEEYAEHRGQPLDGTSSSAAESAPPSALPFGDYSCLHVYYDFLNKRMMTDPLGTLSITGPSSYVWVRAVSGEYTYHSAGAIDWLSGPFAETEVLESVVEMKGDDPMLKITFETNGRSITYRCYLSS